MDWKHLITSLEPSFVSDDQIDGLKLMLQQESFKEVHSDIEAKLKEIEQLKNKGKELQSSFSLETGKFYLTENNSIVFTCKQSDEISLEYLEVVVLQGGFKDPDSNSDLFDMLYGSFKVGHIYYVNNVGKAVAAVDEPHYPMHIMKQITRNKAFDLSIS